MAIHRRSGSVLRVVAAVVTLLPLVSCESDTVLPPMVIVTPPPPTRVVLMTTAYSGIEPDNWVAWAIPLSVTGTLDITVDWTFPESWIYVYFGDTACSYDEISSKRCPFLISSETTTPKPRVLTTNVLQPGTYYLVLYNVPWDPRTRTGGHAGESVAITVGVTVAATSGTHQPVAFGEPFVTRR